MTGLLLAGKAVVVTGAASGMGASTAKIFAREGCKVVIADQLDDDGKKIAAEIVAANGAASFHHLDVTDEANWKAVVEATIAEATLSAVVPSWPAIARSTRTSTVG